MQTEHEILEACLVNLRALDPVKEVNLRERDNRVPREVDAKLVLRTDAGQLVYLVEVRRTLSAPRLEHLLLQLARYSHGTNAKPLLLSDYIPPGVAERLIRAGVNFVDAAGNIYLQWPHKLHIQIQGARPKRLPEKRTERLSQPSGLQVLYALLTQAPSAWKSYRDLARAAGVALGSIAWVMRELKAKGYLVEKGRNIWTLTNKGKLMDLWVGGYGGRLRPKLLIDRYQPLESDLKNAVHHLQDELEDRKISWALTGGFAADVLTRHFRGAQLSFFAQEWPVDLTGRLKWLPSADGPVTVLRQFSPLVVFDLKSPHSQPVAHPLLVYAELMFQGRERELETAKILYDRYLAALIHEEDGV